MGQERVTCVEGRTLDNIDLNQMSHRYVNGVLQSDWNDPSTSAHLLMIDRREDTKLESQSGEYCRFQFMLLKKGVTSVIDSAVLHWTTRLMVFRRNLGFGRCYLVNCPRRDFAQKAKSRGGTLVIRPYIKESTYSWNIQSYSQYRKNLDLLEQGPRGIGR